MAFEDVTMYDVDSSNVDAFGYDENEQVLYVRFRQGRLYWYAGVDSSVYDAFMMAPSKGKFVWQYLRGHYEYGEM
jgi:hypothetical protein